MKKKSKYKGYTRAMILGCSNKAYWYYGRNGRYVWVKEMQWPSAYVEAMNGFSVLKKDLYLTDKN